MGVEILRLLLCDGGVGCPIEGEPFADQTYSRGYSIKQQRSKAKSEGWIHRNGKDFCPDCAGRIKKEADRG